MNTIEYFISYTENIQIFNCDRTRKNTEDFITFDDNIYGIHSKRVNILYIFTDRNVHKCTHDIS